MMARQAPLGGVESKEAVKRVYRYLLKKKEDKGLLRLLIARNEVDFFTFCRKAFEKHRLLQKLSGLHVKSALITKMNITKCEMSLSLLRFYYRYAPHIVSSMSALFLLAWLFIGMVYFDLLDAIQKGKERQTEKTKQIISVIEEMRR